MIHAYRGINMRADRLLVVEQANEIIEDYNAQGYQLTLRQLYYQFVSRDLIPNQDKEYKRLGDIIADARYAGLISWDAIEDRTRNLQSRPHWDSPEAILDAATQGYLTDKWDAQPCRVEVWVEKEALAGIVQRSAAALDVPYIACRGYMSASEMHAAAMRFLDYQDAGQEVCVLHLGDHDPSGIDMSRDIQDRINEFLLGHDGEEIEFERSALNMAQVRTYNPPPNPAKLTDSRCTGYIRTYGNQSWELDALEPSVLDALIRDAVLARRNEERWEQSSAAEREQRETLEKVSERWEEVAAFLAA